MKKQIQKKLQIIFKMLQDDIPQAMYDIMYSFNNWSLIDVNKQSTMAKDRSIQTKQFREMRKSATEKKAVETAIF